ncbi:MAG: pseudouridine synthase [Pseudobacter sp.]|uniref:pseudouridine synthase n=1 Tax=Pseudobacter sp. TaxID=2045420 RepID=UPI003F7E579C
MKKQPQGFKKFIQTEEKGSQKKERIRQEKKAMRKETQEYFAKKKEEAKAARATGNTAGNTKSKWGNRGNEGADRIEKKKQARAEENQERGERSFKGKERGSRPSKSNARGGFKKSKGLGPRAFKKAGGYKGAMEREAARAEKKTDNKGYRKNEEGAGSSSKPVRFSKTDKPAYNKTEKPAFNKPGKPAFSKSDKPAFNKSEKPSFSKSEKPVIKKDEKSARGSFATRIEGAGPVARKGENPVKVVSKSKGDKNTEEKEAPVSAASNGTMPVNKFIAHAGVCSRRDAAEVVKSGKVVVNGKVVTEPGFKVTTKDEVKVNGKQVAVRRNLVYILLNKPKDYITTTEDPQGRKTVLDIVRNATTERVYPIGRLDRNTTGVLLLTNDGELAQKLSHPSYEIRKIYEVTLDKPLVKKDFDAIMGGIKLEDGLIQPDALAYADSKDKAIIGIEIHSGRNRIVRRIFESLGYDVRNLDRVMYANLTKKNVDRGKWRLLSEKEVRLLKYLNASYTNKNKPARRG